MSNPLNLQDFSALRKPQYGLTVGLPTLGSHRMEFTLALMQAGFPINTIGQYIPVVGHTVAEARNMITHVAKQTHSKYLLFLDEDTLPPANAFRKLVWDMDNNPHVTVTAGVYATKSDPPMPLLFEQPGVGPSYDWHRGDFRKVYAIGMGCTIIRVADLEKLDGVCGTAKIDDFPHIGFNTEVVEYFRDGTCWIDDPSLATKGWSMTFTEDMYFCQKCHDVGLNVYADTSVIAAHIDSNGKVYGLGDCLPMQNKVDVSNGIYFDLGSGEMMRHWVDGTRMLRVDLDPALKPDYVQDVRNLDIRDNLADGVSAIHVLEHMSRHDAEKMLDEMVRILKPGASLVISLPDMQCIAEYYIKVGQLNDFVLRAIFGWQVNEFQFHKSGWDEGVLRAALKRRGCTVTQVKKDADLMQLELWAQKGTPPTAEVGRQHEWLGAPLADQPAAAEAAAVDVPVTVVDVEPVTDKQYDFADPTPSDIMNVAHAETGDIKESV